METVNANVRLLNSLISWFSEPSHGLLDRRSNSTRHEINKDQQEGAVNCPRRRLGNLVCNVRYELNQNCPKDRTADRRDAADHNAHQKAVGKKSSEAVRRHKLNHDRTERIRDVVHGPGC